MGGNELQWCSRVRPLSRDLRRRVENAGWGAHHPKTRTPPFQSRVRKAMRRNLNSSLPIQHPRLLAVAERDRRASWMKTAWMQGQLERRLRIAARQMIWRK